MTDTAHHTADPIDPITFRNACGSFATGVTIITTRSGDRDHGMTANAFMSISLDPALIAISVANTAKMRPLIEEAGRFAVSILREDTNALAMHFAGRPDPEITDPLRELQGLPVARAATAVFVADLAQSVAAGDHQIFVGQVTALETDPHPDPLLFHKGQFGTLEKPPATQVTANWIGEEICW